MTKRTLIIGNKNYSSWSLRPWLFLRKNKIDFQERQLWLDTPAFKPAIDPVGSGGKVPVLLDGKLIAWDSLSIIETAIDRFDCRYGWPQAVEQRAHARSIVCEMHSSFVALRIECSMDIRNCYQTKLSDQAKADIKRICEIWSQALDMSDQREGWLYGRFSVADAMFAPVVFRLEGHSIGVDSTIRNYMDHVLADEAIKEWVDAAKAEKHVIVI